MTERPFGSWCRGICRFGSPKARLATLENPTVGYRLGRIEHSGKAPNECHLAAQTMQIDPITTRPFVEPRLEGGSKRAGGGVLALSSHPVPASEFCRSVVVLEC